MNLIKARVNDVWKWDFKDLNEKFDLKKTLMYKLILFEEDERKDRYMHSSKLKYLKISNLLLCKLKFKIM